MASPTPPSSSTPALVLALNAGSSSIKFAVFDAAAEFARVFSGKFERIGLSGAALTLTHSADKRVKKVDVNARSHAECVPHLIEALEREVRFSAITEVVHRVVHGGNRFWAPETVTPEMLATLKQIVMFAPEHLPAEIALIEAVQRHSPELRQVACFDTAFHHELPDVAQRLPIPRKYFERGVRRYGFHGISYAYLLGELERIAGREAARGRVIIAHLGNGASMAAVRDGKCVDTSMSFTPTAGLVMSTRAGDLDPGLAAYFARNEGIDVEAFHRMINAESGLLGISESSSDVRDLLEREKSDPRAADALAAFCYQAKKYIGAFSAVLGGLDTLVFSGGIGENSVAMRARICAGMAWLGIEIDDEKNARGEQVLSRSGSRVVVRVIRTDEELAMAKSINSFTQRR